MNAKSCESTVKDPSEPSPPCEITPDAVDRIIESVRPEKLKQPDRDKLLKYLQEIQRKYRSLCLESVHLTVRDLERHMSALEKHLKAVKKILPVFQNTQARTFKALEASAKTQEKSSHSATDVEEALNNLSVHTHDVLSLISTFRSQEKEFLRKGAPEKSSLYSMKQINWMINNKDWHPIFSRAKAQFHPAYEIILYSLPSCYFEIFGEQSRGGKVPATGKFDGPSIRFTVKSLLELGVLNPKTEAPFTENQVGELWNHHLRFKD